tara:strand:- start:95 stop:808 length:714 start_codon:yes stop_codon:yes gene_type:complete
MNILCTICARSGSKGVPHKNLKDLIGKPLLTHSIKHARKSGLFNYIVVSTDCEEIRKISEEFGAYSWFLRPKRLSLDSSPKIPVIRHALQKAETKFNTRFDIIVDLDATSPLRTQDDISGALKFFQEGNYDNLITGSISRKNPYFNMVEISDLGKLVLCKQTEDPPKSRQEAPKVFDLNASIYIWKREALLNRDDVISSNTAFYEMPEDRSYDIDSSLDWKIVEMIMKDKNEQYEEK